MTNQYEVTTVTLVCPHCKQTWSRTPEDYARDIEEQRQKVRRSILELQAKLIALMEAVFRDVPDPPSVHGLLWCMEELAGQVDMLNVMQPGKHQED